MTILCAKDLTQSAFIELVRGLHFAAEEPVRLWLEGVDGWSLAYWKGLSERLPWCAAGREPIEEPAEGLLRRANAGRLFAPSGELRWRVLPMLGEVAWRTVYLGQQRQGIEELTPSKELDGLTVKLAEYPLWGLLSQASRRPDGLPGEWIEIRIPHRFRYPVSLPKQSGGQIAVKARVERWLDGRGDLHFLRLCDLSSYSMGD